VRKRVVRRRAAEELLGAFYRRTIRLAEELGERRVDRVVERAGMDEGYYGALLVKNALGFKSLRERGEAEP